MSEEQLSALLASLKEDAGLREKLKCAEDFDAAVAIAKDAGFDVSHSDWLRYQAKQILLLSDEELESSGGGGASDAVLRCDTGWGRFVRCGSFGNWYDCG